MNKEILVSSSCNLSAVSGRFLSRAIIDDNGGEESIINRGIPNYTKSSVSEETYNQLDEFEGVTLLAGDNITEVNYGTKDQYEISNGLFKTVNEVPGWIDSASGQFSGTNDDDGESYYFRGAVDNNHIQFGKNSNGQNLYWRIIRINGDGSIRLIYSGTEVSTHGLGDVIGMHHWRSPYTDNAFVGFMYGDFGGHSLNYAQAHANERNSAAKIYLDNWYVQNIEGQDFEGQIEPSAIFCNNRNVTSNQKGYGLNGGSYTAGVTSQPSLHCLNRSELFAIEHPLLENHDQFTVKNSGRGNQALTYPIGLITAAELGLAGFNHSSGCPAGASRQNGDIFLFSTIRSWTMTPHDFWTTHNSANTCQFENGSLTRGATNLTLGIRPVINLKDTVVASGNGTAADPYIVYNLNT